MQPQVSQKNSVTMAKTLMTSLTIILLTGNSWAENILFPGPVYGGTGEQVHFNTIFSSPLVQFQTIVWSFGKLNIITSTLSGSDTVGPEYKDRVSLNKTSGALTLQSLRLNDTGVYTVILTPVDGTQTLQGNTVLDVFVPVTGVNLKGPNSTLVEGKSSAYLTCEGNGSIITTLWMKDGQHLSESNSISFSADNRSVSINPVSRSDIGEYVCVLSNPISSEMANYNITVFYGPNVKILGADIVKEGSDILLYCSVSSLPPATLIWTVNYVNAGNSALYIIESSNSSHSGIYTCAASNHITGLITSAEHILTVRGTSDMLLTPGEIAGIVVGVILVVLLAVSVFFNFRNFKGHIGKVKVKSKKGKNKGNMPNQPRQAAKRVEMSGVHVNPMNKTVINYPDPDTDNVYEEFDEPDEPTYVN